MNIFSNFSTSKAIKLIESGFDGSNANQDALIKSRAYLRELALSFRKYAACNPNSKVYYAMINRAAELEKIANKVKF